MWRYMDFLTNLKDGQREGVGELFLAEDETVSRAAVHVDAGQCVHFGVHPVQTLVDQVCPERDTQRQRYLTGQYNCVLLAQFESKLLVSI